MGKRVFAPAALLALKQALTDIYWYKSDLRSFLTATLSRTAILGQLNWDDYKRNIVSTLVDSLASNQANDGTDLLRVITEVARIDDYSHLLRLEDGDKKARQAQKSVAALQKYIGKPTQDETEQKAVEDRRKAAYEAMIKTGGVSNKLVALTQDYYRLLGNDEPQRRGYLLEKVLKDLFTLFDLDPKASFKVTGEQIDGAFTFQSTDYLLEAKWQKEPVTAADLDSLGAKLSRKLDNTLGFISP